jgi:hypothetical protein
MEHLLTFYSHQDTPAGLNESAALWRVIDDVSLVRERGPFRQRLDSFSEGQVSTITALFANYLGSCDRLRVLCLNIKDNPGGSFPPVWRADDRVVSKHDLTAGTKEVRMPRTPVHRVTVRIDWHRHIVSAIKSDDDYYLVNIDGENYLCDGMAGVESLLSGRVAGLFAKEGPYLVMRGDVVYRPSMGFYLVASSTTASDTWVPAMFIGGTRKSSIIFNTENAGVSGLRSDSFLQATPEQIEGLGRAAHSGRYDRYLRVIEEVTGIDLRGVLPGGTDMGQG